MLYNTINIFNILPCLVILFCLEWPMFATFCW